MKRVTRRDFIKSTLGVAAAGVTFAYGAESSPSGQSASAFSFLHTYEATGRYWRCLEKAGLIRSTTGVRLVQSPFGKDDNRRFNAVARRDGELYGILKNKPSYFIVDRLCGGSPYYPYDFDQSLVAEYELMLGVKLLGGQVHEVLSNVHNDWGRIAKANPKFATEPVDAESIRAYFDWSEANKWIEYGDIAEYHGRTYPKTEAQWWDDYRRAAITQGKRFNGRFSYCEGTHYGELVWHRFYEYGAASCIVEVGPWASSESQFAIASARGSAKAAGKPWGIFYAPWGPGGCTSFIEMKDWSWQAPNDAMEASGFPIGPDKGPSTALQRRIFFHSYLSGANTMHEEWGAEGNFTNWDDATLSSYGLVTRDLLDFQDAHPDVGRPFTPISLILDANWDGKQSAAWKDLKGRLYVPSEAENPVAERGAKNAKEEARCYTPCAFPELFDIVPSTALASTLASYRVTIPVGGSASLEQTWDALVKAVDEFTPFVRTSHLPMQVNFRESDKTWIVGIYNPWGAQRGDVYGVGSELDESSSISDTLEARFPIESARVLHGWPSSSGMSREGQKLGVTVGPGGTLILEVRQRA
ncbi:MAG: hypothetical protein K1Y02_08360 [Candidatus Hydrogenedentes bacterium]|nr:hypothetical protein [Candidatus Hydrogenedentota bacterium]